MFWGEMKILAQIRRMQNNPFAPTNKGQVPDLASLTTALKAAQETPSASGGVLSWIKNPSIALSTFKSYITKRATVEIDDTFKASMEGVVKVKNKTLDELISQYSSKNPVFASLLTERKKLGLKVRVQLLNLIASVVDYLQEYKNSASKGAMSGAKLINVTENVLDDILLYLVYIYERDKMSINIKDSLRARGNMTRLPNTMEQAYDSALAPWFAKQYELPYEFNVILNTIIQLNSQRAKIWGILPGYGIRETSHFPYLEGTDNDELMLDELDQAYAQYIQMARAVERKKVKVLGYEPVSTNLKKENRGNLLITLERLADEIPDTEENLSNYRKERNIAISQPTNVPAPSAPAPSAPAMNTSNNSYMNLFHNANSMNNRRANMDERPANPQSQVIENTEDDIPVFNNSPAAAPDAVATARMNNKSTSANLAPSANNKSNSANLVPSANNKSNSANLAPSANNNSSNSNSNGNQPPQKRMKLNRKSRKSSRKSSRKTRTQRKNRK